MRTFLTFLLISLGSSTALAASFDCQKARSYTEKTICDDSELSSFDEELNQIYQHAKEVAARKGEQQAFKEENKREWVWRENNCQDRACILQWYKDRKERLLQWSADESLAAPQITQQEPDDNTSVSENDSPPLMAVPNATPADVVPGKTVVQPVPATPAVAQVNQEAPAESFIHRAKKVLSTILGWAGVICIGLAILMEPSEPKRDRRFKTGYKNNAKKREKSDGEVAVQTFLGAVGAVSLFIWYLLS